MLFVQELFTQYCNRGPQTKQSVLGMGRFAFDNAYNINTDVFILYAGKPLHLI